MKMEEYWPLFLREVKEFKEISKAENPEIEKLWQSLDDLMDNQFIETTTDRGIARREKLLKITPFADDDLESRRFRVKAIWNDRLPYTYRVLEDRLDQLCGEDGYKMVLGSDLYSLKIKIELVNKRMFDEVKKVSEKMAPANLVISVELLYNQHSTLARFTHGQLQAYTHDKLRNEVIV